MRKQIIFWGSALVFSYSALQDCFPQNKENPQKSASMEYAKKTSQFDLYLGAGSKSGLRLGFRKRIQDNYFGELSIGQSLNSYIGGATLRNIIGLGGGWSPLSPSNLTTDLLLYYIQLPDNSSVHSFIFSPNISYNPIRRSGIHSFARVGFFIELKKDGSGNSTTGGVNLDLGFAWGF